MLITFDKKKIAITSQWGPLSPFKNPLKFQISKKSIPEVYTKVFDKLNENILWRTNQYYQIPMDLWTSFYIEMHKNNREMSH